MTISGKLRYAYEATKSATGAKANGARVTDGDLNFAAVEDLGGGLKATAAMAYVSRGRDTAITARDASLSLAGGFGSVMIGSVEAGNGIIGLGGAGAPVYGLDDGVTLAGASNVDIIKYTSPAFNGFTFSVNTTDATTVLGQESVAATVDSTGFGVNYANGPLTAAADVTNYGRNAYVPSTAAQIAAGVPDSRTRISANYNLGVATVGAGFQTSTNVANLKNTQQIFGVSVPMGAFVLGAVAASSKMDGVVGTNKGTDLGVQYNLSKRTFLAGHYQTTKAAGATASASKYRVQLAHAF